MLTKKNIYACNCSAFTEIPALHDIIMYFCVSKVTEGERMVIELTKGEGQSIVWRKI